MKFSNSEIKLQNLRHDATSGQLQILFGNSAKTSDFIADGLEYFWEHLPLAERQLYYPTYHSKYNPIERCWCLGEALEWCQTERCGNHACMGKIHDLERLSSCCDIEW